ncbi:TlpA family protein disulfide reductase (plasmid) [Burkholderia pyrrocinia]|uniref:TlpA family protein disulfide reductase n=1 Tax=Burkholderia pyrrocinia TaxID=60550 RepID=UPI0038B5F987
MNNETPDHSDAPRPPSDTAAKRGAGQHDRRTTRRFLLAGLGAAGLAAVATAYGQLVPDDVVGGVAVHAHTRELPLLRFTDGNGTATSLTAFRNRVVLLNVWATWCSPCRQEMPTLDRLQATLGGPHFEVVAVSIDAGGLPVVQGFFREIGIKHLRPYLDAFHDVAALIKTGIPITLLVDRDGREAGRKLGPATWDNPQIIQLIRRYLPA